MDGVGELRGLKFENVKGQPDRGQAKGGRISAHKRLLFRLGATAAAAAMSLIGSIEVSERLSGSTMEFAATQLAKEAFGRREPIEIEALELARAAAAELGVGSLTMLRFGMADALGGMEFSARFNPLAFRVALSTRLMGMEPSHRRLALLHEMGHAVAFATKPMPDFKAKSASAKRIVDESLLGNQIYQEAYADVFAVAWALRANSTDPAANGLLAASRSGRDGASMAHDSRKALLILRSRLPEAMGAEAATLPDLIAQIASQGAAETLAALGAEREAACHMGARAAARLLTDGGYGAFHLPWEAAKTGAVSPSDPLAEGYAELALLAPPEPPSFWSISLSASRASAEELIAMAGASDPRQDGSPLPFALSRSGRQGSTLSPVERAASMAARTRTGAPGYLSRFGVWLETSVLEAPTWGCKTIASDPVDSSSGVKDSR